MSSLAWPRTKPLGLPRSIRATALDLLACLIASCTTPPATQQSPQEAPSASADSPGEAHDVFIDRVAEFLDALDAPSAPAWTMDAAPDWPHACPTGGYSITAAFHTRAALSEGSTRADLISSATGYLSRVSESPPEPSVLADATLTVLDSRGYTLEFRSRPNARAFVSVSSPCFTVDADAARRQVRDWLRAENPRLYYGQQTPPPLWLPPRSKWHWESLQPWLSPGVVP